MKEAWTSGRIILASDLAIGNRFLSQASVHDGFAKVGEGAGVHKNSGIAGIFFMQLF